MTFSNALLFAGVLSAGMFVTSAGGQTPAGQQPAPPAAVVPSQSPAAPTSAGAAVIKYEMEMLDKDRDGFVSRAEASGVPMLINVFDKFDRNRDNKLDPVELEAAEQAQPR
jgi:hypothetical protein